MNAEELAELKAQNDKLIAELNEEKQTNRKKENKFYIDTLLRDGVLYPSQKDCALDLLNIATSIDNGEEVAELNAGENVLEHKIKDLLNKANILKIPSEMQTATLSIMRPTNSLKQTRWTEQSIDMDDPDSVNQQIENLMREHPELNYKQAFERLFSYKELWQNEANQNHRIQHERFLQAKYSK